MPGLVFEAGLVAGVGFEESPVEVGDGGASNALVEEAARIADVGVPDHGAEALDRPDAREHRDHRVAYSRAQQELRLVDVGIALRPRRQGHVEEVGAELLAVLTLPRLDRRRTKARAR
ncbi:MAG: hypothetical protein ACRDY6_05455 [Acidimicrobiia bacterium]